MMILSKKVCLLFVTIGVKIVGIPVSFLDKGVATEEAPTTD
jgi:hypothetical protein